eukprot:TRINITY_DN4018_c0_g1_i1.p1 TRINITY_DN4018_c0_g1~~TRINITY_DN4018_c0_g1_i1.p1  ORF type:complete len:1091 (-),score=90.93 TRINITY_DN4018_c0_g1_i1:122-3121(-)
MMGTLSPRSRVTLPPEERQRARIPVQATHFAFAYPLPGVNTIGKKFDLNDPRHLFLTIGGFIYFDPIGRPIRKNGIAAGKDLFFDGPYKLPRSVRTALEGQGRLQPVTIPDIKQTGAEQFAWLGPSEFSHVSTDHEFQMVDALPVHIPFGGFAYKFPNQPDSCCYFRCLADQPSNEQGSAHVQLRSPPPQQPTSDQVNALLSPSRHMLFAEKQSRSQLPTTEPSHGCVTTNPDKPAPSATSLTAQFMAQGMSASAARAQAEQVVQQQQQAEQQHQQQRRSADPTWPPSNPEPPPHQQHLQLQQPGWAEVTPPGHSHPLGSHPQHSGLSDMSGPPAAAPVSTNIPLECSASAARCLQPSSPSAFATIGKKAGDEPAAGVAGAPPSLASNNGMGGVLPTSPRIIPNLPPPVQPKSPPTTAPLATLASTRSPPTNDQNTTPDVEQWVPTTLLRVNNGSTPLIGMNEERERERDRDRSSRSSTPSKSHTHNSRSTNNTERRSTTPKRPTKDPLDYKPGHAFVTEMEIVGIGTYCHTLTTNAHAHDALNHHVSSPFTSPRGKSKPAPTPLQEKPGGPAGYDSSEDGSGLHAKHLANRVFTISPVRSRQRTPQQPRGNKERKTPTPERRRVSSVGPSSRSSTPKQKPRSGGGTSSNRSTPTNGAPSKHSTPLNKLLQPPSGGLAGCSPELMKERKSFSEQVGDMMQKAGLQELVGLTKVKEAIKRMARQALVEDERRRHKVGQGLSAAPMHMVFMGNSGTGKTTIARLLCNVLKDAGVIKRSRLVEVHREDLVGEHIGHTEKRTSEVISSAKGGILFVDEAYRLAATESPKDYGRQALETLQRAMMDGDPLIIFAGRQKPMQQFLDTNDGMRRRITYHFHFEDYSAIDLAVMFKRYVVKQNYQLHPQATTDSLVTLMRRCVAEKDLSTVNAGLVELWFQRSWMYLNGRLEGGENSEQLVTLSLEDLTMALCDIAAASFKPATTTSTPSIPRSARTPSRGSTRGAE